MMEREKNDRIAFYVMEVEKAGMVRLPEKFYAKDWVSAKRTAVRSYKVYKGTVLYLNDHLDENGYVPAKGGLFRGKDGKWVPAI